MVLRHGRSMKSVKVYRNEDVKRIVAFILPGHRHLRLLIELEDQIIVLQEASVAAVVRAYIDVVTHPSRRAVEMISKHMSSDDRKPGYTEFQLIESGRGEDEVLREVSESLGY